MHPWTWLMSQEWEAEGVKRIRCVDPWCLTKTSYPRHAHRGEATSLNLRAATHSNTPPPPYRSYIQAQCLAWVRTRCWSARSALTSTVAGGGPSCWAVVTPAARRAWGACAGASARWPARGVAPSPASPRASLSPSSPMIRRPSSSSPGACQCSCACPATAATCCPCQRMQRVLCCRGSLHPAWSEPVSWRMLPWWQLPTTGCWNWRGEEEDGEGIGERTM